MKLSFFRLVVALAGFTSSCAAHSTEYLPCLDGDNFPSLSGSLCATQKMPLSYAGITPSLDSGSADNINIFVRKIPAKGTSKGTVWLVSGGPGESGASLYSMLDVLRKSFPGFDLMIPDHRGTGYSSRLCAREEAVESPGGMALAGAEWGSCFQQVNRHPELVKLFSITNAAYDLRSLIAQSDQTKPIYVYGVSYGTQLVLRAMQIGVLPVSGVILDSLVPMQTAPMWDLSHRSQVVDQVGREVLAECDRSSDCRAMLGDSAENSYRNLLKLAQQDPSLLAQVPGKNLKRFFGSMLDVPEARERIPYLIKDLSLGHGEELKRVFITLKQAGASMGDYPQLTLSIPLVTVISSSENNLRPDLDIADIKREEETLLFSSPLPELMVKPALPTYPRDDYFGKLPEKIPPTLVLNGTLDPKTPYDGALTHIAELSKRGPVGLISVTGAPHFILWTAPDCFSRHVMNFVQKGVPENKKCAISPMAGSAPK